MATQYEIYRLKIGEQPWRVTAIDTNGGFVTLQADRGAEHGFPELCIYMSRGNAADLGNALLNASMWTVHTPPPTEKPDNEELPF